MPPRPSRLHDLALAVLNWVNSDPALASDPFARTYVSDGLVAHDWDEALVVEWQGVQRGAAGSEPALEPLAWPGVYRVVLAIWAIRNSAPPDEAGTPPLPEQITAAALRVHADADAIRDRLLVGIGDDEQDATGPFATCGGAAFLGQDAFGPEGLAVGSVTRIEVTL